MQDKVVDYNTNVLGTTLVISSTRETAHILIEYLEAGIVWTVFSRTI